jgi:hypothetical protein
MNNHIMRSGRRIPVWFDDVIAATSAGLLVLTLLWRDWIEVIFRFDPDQRSGSLEWTILGILSALTIVTSLRAFTIRRQLASDVN